VEAELEISNQKDAAETELAQAMEIQADLEKDCNLLSQKLKYCEQELQSSKNFKIKYSSVLDLLMTSSFFKNFLFTAEGDDGFDEQFRRFLLHYDTLLYEISNNQTELVNLRVTIKSLQTDNDSSLLQLKSLELREMELVREVAELKEKLLVLEEEKSEQSISVQDVDEIASLTAKFQQLNEDFKMEKLNAQQYQSDLSTSKLRLEEMENILNSKEKLHFDIAEDLLRQKNSLSEQLQQKLKEVEYLDSENKKQVNLIAELTVIKTDLQREYNEEKQTVVQLQDLLKSSLESKSFVIAELESSLNNEKSISER
jgi:alpha-glucosidase (family GH31 glycosyl hydrolase)